MSPSHRVLPTWAALATLSSLHTLLPENLQHCLHLLAEARGQEQPHPPLPVPSRSEGKTKLRFRLRPPRASPTACCLLLPPDLRCSNPAANRCCQSRLLHFSQEGASLIVGSLSWKTEPRFKRSVLRCLRIPTAQPSPHEPLP